MSKPKHKCPFCHKTVAASARLCVHCNGPLKDRGTDVRKAVCPRCQRKLKYIKAEGGDEAEVCMRCKSIWFDLESFKRVTNPRRVHKKYADSREHWHRPASKKQVQYAPCPRCGRLMNRENFSRISGVMIDRCRDHGVWLDLGELERIRLFIASGGLERFRDKRLDLVEEKVQALANKTREIDFMQKLIHVWNPKRILFQRTLFR